MHIGIIGAGPAGVALANLLAGNAHVSLINPEQPYDRPPLSKELFTKPYEPLAVEESVHFLQGTARAARQGAQFRVSVDLCNEHRYDTLQVDALVLATGTRPHHYIPQALTLATLDDARCLATQLRDSKHLHIVGGGWIGCEVASVARTEGVEVELWEAEPALLARSFGHWSASPWPSMLTEAGVRLHLGERYPATWQAGGSDNVCLLEATGASPHNDIARDLGCTLSPRGAVLTDLSMRALSKGAHSADNLGMVYAIGDCADIAMGGKNIYYGGHWRKALADAQRCASDILGTPAPRFVEAPEVFSTQFGHEIAFLGHVPHDQATGSVHMKESNGIWEWFDGDKLLAHLSFDQPRSVSKARKALRTPLGELTEEL